MNPLELRVEGLHLRVKRLEEILLGQLGRLGARTGVNDEAMIVSVCEVVGVELDEVRGSIKAPHLVAKRRMVVNLLRSRLSWSWARIARATGKSANNVRRLAGDTRG